MTIKTVDGDTQSVSSSGQGNLAVTLGAIGTGLGLLNGGLGLNGVFGNNGTKYVSKEELDMSMQLAAKDSQIALLESEKSTDVKLVQVFQEAAARDKELRTLIAANKDEQAAVNAQQLAWNATAGAQMSSMATNIANQAAQLSQITTNVVPSNKVCDTCCCNCGS